jgi:primosomal protein N' (replication factor Y)
MQEHIVSLEQHPKQFVRAVSVMSHGHGPSGVERLYQIDQTDTVRVGRIICVITGNTAVSAVVMAVIPPSESQQHNAADVAYCSPYALTTVQLTLIRWIANHYVSTIEHVLSLFISRTMFPAPTQVWNATDSGITADLGTMRQDERGVLYQLRRHGTHTTKELLSTLAVTAPALTKILDRLSQRGYVQKHLQFATIPQRKVAPPLVVTLNRTQLAAADTWILRSPKRISLAALCTATSEQRIPVSSLGGYSAIKDFIERGILLGAEPPRPLPSQPVALTPSQHTVVTHIASHIGTNQYAPFLLHGVTGSGKTEVYFALIEACIARNLQTLVLIPEIALTTQIAERFERRFPGKISVIHGDIHIADRHRGWTNTTIGTTSVVLGPRSALAVPIPRLGLIIVDEEHDASYKSDKSPPIHARDTALVYARFAGIPIVLGSATPSVEMMYACQNNAVTYLHLQDRVGTSGTMHQRPPIRIVDMRGIECADSHGLISTILHERISATLKDTAQVMLLMNRRGASGSRICRNCGTVAQCPRCSSPLIGHGTTRDGVAVCHTCGYQRAQTTHCPSCFHSDFLDFGSGTQRVVQVLRALFPATPILQWDRDTTDSARAHAAMLTEIHKHPSAIIVGTQMIAKGLDLERVKLVGVVNADLALHLPDFRATERTYQLLTQVAGRAGRRAGEASVIFQSYTPDNYAIQCAARYDAEEFYRRELRFREYMGYPPFQRMTKLTWRHTDETQCIEQAQREATAINTFLQHDYPLVRTIGPSPAFFYKVRDRYHWHMLIVGPQVRAALSAINPLHHATIDVDPISTL